MKTKLIAFILCSLFVVPLSAQVNWGEKLKKEVSKVKGGDTHLTNDEIIKGLKEALSVGTNNSTTLASRIDGYYKNPRIKIPFPPDAVKIEKTLRQAGMNKLVDDFIRTLNRAAEEAAKEAAPIFLDAIKNMTIQDGLAILKGNETAATSYLNKQTRTPLMVKFKPVIDRALQKTEATKYWSQIITAYNRIPAVTKMNPDLSAYATGKAIDGLFVLVGEEETKIRKDPAARVSEILRKVFGKS